MADVAVISQHERGFWQADLYLGAAEWTVDEWESGCAPDDFCTAPTRGEVEAEAKRAWPGAALRDAADDDF